MSEFDRRWQECVAHARRVPLSTDEVEVPPGFAARVFAQARPPGRDLGIALLWERLGVRALVGVTTLLVVLGALEYRDSRPAALEMPAIEHSIVSTFWML